MRRVRVSRERTVMHITSRTKRRSAIGPGPIVGDCPLFYCARGAHLTPGAVGCGGTGLPRDGPVGWVKTDLSLNVLLRHA